MTKFEILCETYHQAQEEFKKYRNECHDFANKLWKGLIDHFEIPASQVCLFKVNAEGEYESVPPPLFNALVLRDDSYWQAAFGINVYEAKNVFPQETIILGILFKKVNSHFDVKLIDYEEELSIEKDKLSDFTSFYEYLYKVITTSYTVGLQTFLDQDVTQRRIGFQFGQKETAAS